MPFYDIGEPIAIVHRGGDAAGGEKENSLVAFQSAYEADVMYGETDTVATLDGVALAIHGAKNQRAEKKTGLPLRSALQIMTFDEVEKDVRIGGEKVPTLEEVLLSFPTMRFFIDPKTKEAVKPLATIINNLSVHDRVSVGAFDYRRTKGVTELVGEKRRIATSIGVMGGLALLGNRVNFPMAREYLKRSSATQLALPHDLVSQEMVSRSHDMGLRIVLWTPNEEVGIRRAFDKGADGVMSDRTHLVKAIADTYNN